MKIRLNARASGFTIPVEFSYTPEDPYALTVTIHADEVSVDWLVGRDLLREGLCRAVGEGDVRVTPGAMSVGIHLSSENGKLSMVFLRSDIQEVLRSTDLVVPPGREVIDWSTAAEVFPGIELADAVEGGA